MQEIYMKDKSAGEETRRPVRHQVGEEERERERD